MTPGLALFILAAVLIRAGWKNQKLVDAALGRDTRRNTGNVPEVNVAASDATPNPGYSDLPHGAGGTTPQSIIDEIVIPMAQGHGINVTPASVTAANHRHSPRTLSGNISDHNGPPSRAWAADMSNGNSPTPEMDALARDLAHQFGIPWNGSGAKSVTRDGFRYQLIYRSLVGGNHFNHVHFGVKRV